MLVQIRKASFRKWMHPEQRADIHADIKSSGPSFATASCRVAVGGELIAVIGHLPVRQAVHGEEHHQARLGRCARFQSSAAAEQGTHKQK